MPVKFTKFDMFGAGRRPSRSGLVLHWKGSYSLEQMSDEIAKVEEYLDANRKRYQIKQIYVFFASRAGAASGSTLRRRCIQPDRSRVS